MIERLRFVGATGGAAGRSTRIRGCAPASLQAAEAAPSLRLWRLQPQRPSAWPSTAGPAGGTPATAQDVQRQRGEPP
jgi:hypothetical protein